MGCRPAEGCKGEVFEFKGEPTDCVDGMRHWNQVRPGVFDGGYALAEYCQDDITLELVGLVDGACPAGSTPASPLPSGDQRVGLRMMLTALFLLLGAGEANGKLGAELHPRGQRPTSSARPTGNQTGDGKDLQRDGFIGGSDGRPFTVGAWIESSARPADVGFILDGGAPIGLPDPVGNLHEFRAVIDTDGFTSFELLETDGTIEDAINIFADDTFGISGFTSVPTLPR